MLALRTLITTMTFTLLGSTAGLACEVPLLKIAAGGEVAAGSAQALMDHVNGGGRLRVGWQLDWNVDGHVDITNWAEPSVVSVYDDQVFAQFDDIRRRIPTLEETPDGRSLAGQSGRWSAVLGSDGVLTSHVEGAGERRWSVASEWCADEKAGVAPATLAQNCTPTWTERYRHDSQGATLRGHRESLLEALRRGDSLRVAWGAAYSDSRYSVEHVAEPVFYSIVGGEHVVAQLPEHIAQNTYVRLDGAIFGDQPAVMWRGLLRTDGLFDAVWVNRASGQVVRRLPQRATVSWLTLSPPASCESRPALELAAPDGVVPDAARAAERVPK
jgi:hypothetical protein